MTTTIYRRQARLRPPPVPSGDLALQEPPSLPETQGGGMNMMLAYVPMAVGSSAMMLIFFAPRAGKLLIPMIGVMAAGSVLAIVAQMTRGGGERKRRIRGERRDYLRYLAQMRTTVRSAATAQRSALAWRHPDPGALWSVALTGRLWERRMVHADFAEVRIGTGPQRLAMTIKPMQTKPLQDLEPISARALRRFIEAYTTLADQPTAVFLRGFAQLQLDGDPAAARSTARAVLSQLVTFHGPDELRLAVCAGGAAGAEWDWVKWLPHTQHPSEQDGAGPLRMVAGDVPGLERLLGPELGDRPPFDPGATLRPEEPYLVVVLDSVPLPEGSRLVGAGFRNVLVLRVAAGAETRDRGTLQLQLAGDRMDMVRSDRSGKEIRTELGRADGLSVARAGALARMMSPYRLGDAADTAEPMLLDFDLGRLLGIEDIEGYDPGTTWKHGVEPDRFIVPIGIAEDGSRVELDIKESAQGGMGPHGLLIGATGSGKSELLRTLVLSMAMTHSSEILNFVLVDFKGGATFLGLDALPHTSAVITNLADEAGLVTRMQDALQGEMTRRQELLRRAGNYSSLLDYERARILGGAPLDPLPTLFVVVDEFSELLASHPDFAELFVAIGRLGRSLGVHLLLASQRIDDGRMHKLESHLSYRIGLRTFSAMESRSVIGVPDAYQLPSAPGNGYLRSDVATLVRFKAAYVSGAYRRRSREQRQAEVSRQVVAFGAAAVVAAAPPPVPVAAVPAAPAGDHPSAPTVLSVAAGRLVDRGPAAHQVWLPPLDSPPTLDEILPPLVPDPVLGLTPATWPGRGRLVVPVGVVDRPYDQVRDLHMVDLSGPGGHVGVAGGPQAGKSTLLRTLVTALALTHTPAEVQFYCLDFGGGTLSTLDGLPHVGGVAGRLDPERVSRTVAEVHGVLARRERSFAENGIENMAAYRELRRHGHFADDPYGDVFLVVDNWGSLRADFEALDGPIRQLAGRGLTYGVHVVIAANRWSDVHSALRDQLGTRLELRLGDSIDSMINMRAAAKVPNLPGRGLTPDQLYFLAALPRADGTPRVADLAAAARALAGSVSGCWAGPAAPPVRMLPSMLEVDRLPEPSGRLAVPLGWAETDLEPVLHDFAATPHLTVLGDTGSGKSAVLRLVARAIQRGYAPDEVEVVVIDSRRALIDAVAEDYRSGFAFSARAGSEIIAPLAERLRARVPGPDVTPAQLQRRDWWSGPEVYVLVDDYDLLTSAGSGPLDALLDLLPQGADIGLHVVLARAAAGSSRMAMDPTVRRMQESNTPDLALSCPPTEMPLLNGARPRQLPPGRAVLATRRSGTLLQVGWVPR